MSWRSLHLAHACSVLRIQHTGNREDGAESSAQHGYMSCAVVTLVREKKAEMGE